MEEREEPQVPEVIEDSQEAVDRKKQMRASLKTGSDVRAIVPQNADEAYTMAQIIYKGRMAPKSYTSPQQVWIAIMKGLEIGLGPTSAVQSIAVINGQPSVWGDGAMALVRASGQCEMLDHGIEGEGDDRVAWCITKRVGQEPVRRTFSWQDAVRAGLPDKSGGIWQKYPNRMLEMRARAFAMRDVYADILMGLGIVEEIGDAVGALTIDRRGNIDVRAEQTRDDYFGGPKLEHKPAIPMQFDDEINQLAGIERTEDQEDAPESTEAQPD